jgi:hypothetical protein
MTEKKKWTEWQPSNKTQYPKLQITNPLHVNTKVRKTSFSAMDSASVLYKESTAHLLLKNGQLRLKDKFFKQTTSST